MCVVLPIDYIKDSLGDYCCRNTFFEATFPYSYSNAMDIYSPGDKLALTLIYTKQGRQRLVGEYTRCHRLR
jgi:hypothetical protein